MQANGRLQRWDSKGLRPESLVEAAARDFEGFRGFKGLKAGKRAVLNPLKNRWQRHVVAVRVVALERLAGLKPGKRQSRANGSLEPREKQMAGACSCKSCCLGGLGRV